MRPGRSQSSGPRGRRFSDGGGGGGGSVGAGRRASSSTPGSKRGAASRDSSTGSREVRCGCQYYQSDSLLPERISLVGTRPSSRAMGDHEYEPISPPQARAVVPALSVTDIEGVTMQEPPAGPDSEPILSDDSSGSPTRAAPVDVNVRVPYDGEEEVRTMGEDSDHDLDPELGRDENLGPDGDLEDDVLTAQQYQDEMEAQFFNLPSVVSTPSTAPVGGYPVESQTSAESQVDSSQPSQGSSGFPQRLRTQAGRIRTKLRSINRPKLPTIPRPKRPNISFPKFSRSAKNANTSSSDSTKDTKSKENQPPKERHLSSESTSGSSKNIFNFSTVPRVFSRKPKRPKSARSTSPPATLEVESSLDSAPRRKSISQRFVEKVRDIHFAEDDPEEKRRKEQEREEKREKEMHDRYLKQRERRESKEKEREQKELEKIRKENEKYAKRVSVDVAPATAPTKGKRTKDEGLVYHVSLHGSDSEPDYVEDPFNGPPYPEISEDDLNLALLTKPRSEGPSRTQSAMDIDNSLQDYSRDQSVDPNTGQETPASPGDSDRENRSSGTSSERHRRGVLEEIDSDEFFLRQKGISQEDVEMGRFISSEIRDALRAPEGTRDWSRIEYADDEDEDEEIEEGYPEKPERSAIKTIQSSTLPPSRPSRSRTLRPWRQGRKIPPTPPGDEPEEEEEDEEEELVQEPPVDSSNYYNTFPPTRPTRTGKAKKKSEEEIQLDDESVLDREFEDIGPENEAPELQQRLDESVAIFSEDFGILAPTALARKEPPPRPQPPKRLRKSMTSLERDRADDPLAREDWQSKTAPHDNEVLALAVEVDYIIPPAPGPPVAPARRRPRSRATSQADEDRTSRGAESLQSERDIDIVDIDVVDFDGHIIDDQADNRGQPADSYALVSKQQPEQRPRRSRSAKTLAAPGRRKRNQQGRFQNWRQFFSLPRRSSKATTTKSTAAEPPVRPMRNYSTLGPARPPRRSSRLSREYLYVEDEILNKTELQIEPEAEAESAKDLQSSEITMKMKDRPLPAPPRPPRRSHEGGDREEEEEEECRQVILPDHVSDEAPHRRPSREEHREALAALRDDFFSRSRETPPPEPPPVPRSPTGEELEPVFEPPYKTFRKKKKVPPIPTEDAGKVESVPLQSAAPPEEVSIAIQTDPLPDDFCVQESIHQDDQSISQYEPTTETVTTESWPTVVEADATDAEDLPSMTSSSKKRSIPEASTDPPPIPPRLHVSELDVSRLNVSELQAHRLTVSEIDSATLTTSELAAQAGSLSVASGELPHTLAQAVADAVQSALSGVNEALSRPLEIVQQQHELQQQMRELQELQQLHQQQSEQSQQLVLQQLQAQLHQLAAAEHLPPPVPPPPPSYSIQTQTSHAEAPAPPPVNLSYSIQTQTSLAEAPSPPVSPLSSIQTQTSLAESPAPPVPPSLTESELQALSISSHPPPPPPPRRVRTPVSVESDDSEEVPSRSPPSSRRRRTHSSHSNSQPTDELDVTAAGRQLAVACRTSLARALSNLYSSIEPTLTAALSDGESNAKRRELQAALCLVLIVAAAMVILSCGCMGSKVQHHHWDFHLPPPL